MGRKRKLIKKRALNKKKFILNESCMIAIFELSKWVKADEYTREKGVPKQVLSLVDELAEVAAPLFAARFSVAGLLVGDNEQTHYLEGKVSDDYQVIKEKFTLWLQLNYAGCTPNHMHLAEFTEQKCRAYNISMYSSFHKSGNMNRFHELNMAIVMGDLADAMGDW